jgi:hypothetical protein
VSPAVPIDPSRDFRLSGHLRTLLTYTNAALPELAGKLQVESDILHRRCNSLPPEVRASVYGADLHEWLCRLTKTYDAIAEAHCQLNELPVRPPAPPEG